VCRSATIAAALASWRSVLSVQPESSNRTRADNVGGTSNTVSPAATSCRANNAPSPPADSMAHLRDVKQAANSKQPVALASIRADSQLADHGLAVVEHRRGV
jgi:hypothetical protein